MKKTLAYILMLFSIVLINYSLKAYAEDTKPIIGSEFSKSYKGANIKDLIKLLGKPNDVKERRDLNKYARPGHEITIYTWNWNDIDKLPVKIISDRKEGTPPYYIDHIRVKTEGEEITGINLESNHHFLIP